MPPQNRHDFDRRASQNKFETPQVQRPTPNIDDLIIVEDVVVKAAQFVPLDYGTPHPNDAAALLVWSGPTQSNGQDVTQRRIYATTRTAQEAYNYAIKYAAEAVSAPTHIRTYILPRAGYVAGTKGQALTSLIGITLTAGGTGYPNNGPITVNITGGSGSGATAQATVQNGAIVAVTLTNGGSGYVSSPSVAFVAASGSGATATAVMQASTEVLVAEEVQGLELDNPQLNSLFHRVIRTYKTLPGPILTNQRINARGETETETTQEQLNSSATLFPDGLNVTASTLESADTVVATKKYSTVPSHPTVTSRQFEAQRTMGARTIVFHDIVSPGSSADALPGIDVEGGPLVNISGIATGTPGVITANSHGLTTGDKAFFSGVAGGTPALANQIYPVTVLTSNTFSLVARDGTPLAITVAGTGGQVCKAAILSANIREATLTKSEKEVTYRAEDQPIYIPDWETDPRTDVPVLTLKREVNTSEVPTTWGTGVGKAISSIAVGGVIVCPSHGFSTGDKIFLTDIANNIPDINNKSWQITVTDSNTFSIPTGTMSVAGTGGIAAKIGSSGMLAIRESLINAGVMTQNDALDYKTFDRWSSIQIVCKIPALVGGNWTRTYASSMQHRFPDVLLSAGFLWASAIAGTGFEALDIALECQIQKGYEGVCVSRVTDILTYNPNPYDAVGNPSGLRIPDLTIWHPKIYELPAAYAIAGPQQATARCITFRIPPVIHTGITLAYSSGIGTPSGATSNGGDITLTQTDSSLPTSGSYYVADITTEKWRFGSYLVRILEIKHP